MIIIDDINSQINPGGGITKIFDELRCRFDRDSVPYAWLDNGVLGHSSRWLERYRACDLGDRARSQKAVFHSTYYRLPKQRVPVVTTVHDFTYERVLGGPKKWVHSAQKSWAIRGSDIIACVSENTKQDLLYYNPSISPDRCCVVYNGVSDDFYVIEGLKTNNRVLFVGDRSRYKNFGSAVMALAAHPDLRLACIGGGQFKPRELALMRRYIPNRFEHLGYLSVAGLNEAYNQAFCLLYPSLYEGFGIPVIEAQKAGCPVIACAASSIPEVAGDAAILMESGSPDEIVEALESAGKAEHRAQLRQAGFQNAAKFSWERNYETTFSLYNRFID
jgi:mannosyltransferase